MSPRLLDDDRYSIDAHAYGAHVRWLADHGVTGIVPFGTNGEGPSIAAREKRPLFEALAAGAGDLQIIATVAEANLPDTLDQLAFLDDLPVRAVMVMPPYYFKPVEVEGLKIFYEQVLAATRHPVVLYHIPKYAIPIPVELVTSIPVWGVKDSGGEAGYAETLHGAGKGVLVGTEDDLPRRLLTADGSISAPCQYRSRASRRALLTHTCWTSGGSRKAFRSSLAGPCDDQGVRLTGGPETRGGAATRPPDGHRTTATGTGLPFLRCGGRYRTRTVRPGELGAEEVTHEGARHRRRVLLTRHRGRGPDRRRP